MTDRELMQQALEALEWNLPVIEDYGDHEQLNRQHRAITALRERLAQPDPPVLTGIDCSCGKKWRILNNTLTASEPETVMAEYKHQTYAAYKTDGEMKIGVVPEQEPEQEPVAWMFQHEETGRMMFVEAQQLEWGFEKGNPRLNKIAPLYTAPPQRNPWVGLTEDELWDLWNSYIEEPFPEWFVDFKQAYKVIEAKLKEKNT